MARHVGLARIVCPSCESEQLVSVGALVADEAVSCPGCGEPESARAILGRHAELADLVQLMRDLGSWRAGRRRRDGSSPRGALRRTEPA
jgi:hypothetical protein